MSVVLITIAAIETDNVEQVQGVFDTEVPQPHEEFDPNKNWGVALQGKFDPVLYDELRKAIIENTEPFGKVFRCKPSFETEVLQKFNFSSGMPARFVKWVVTSDDTRNTRAVVL